MIPQVLYLETKHSCEVCVLSLISLCKIGRKPITTFPVLLTKKAWWTLKWPTWWVSDDVQPSEDDREWPEMTARAKYGYINVVAIHEFSCHGVFTIIRYLYLNSDLGKDVPITLYWNDKVLLTSQNDFFYAVIVIFCFVWTPSPTLKNKIRNCFSVNFKDTKYLFNLTCP